jgi:hypothetical protein
MTILLQAVCRAGLNRGLIRDALAGVEQFKGVTGEMVFDPNSKNIVPLFLATVRNGKYDFRRYPMASPLATVGENGRPYHGPDVENAPAGPIRIAVFGPQAKETAARLSAIAAEHSEAYAIVGVASDVPWGKASSELVKLIYDDHILAIIATDRNASHLAEQLAAKAFLPVLAMSPDRSLSGANVPWLFHAPEGTDAVGALGLLLNAADVSGPNRVALRDRLAAPVIAERAR